MLLEGVFRYIYDSHVNFQKKSLSVPLSPTATLVSVSCMFVVFYLFVTMCDVAPEFTINVSLSYLFINPFAIYIFHVWILMWHLHITFCLFFLWQEFIWDQSSCSSHIYWYCSLCSCWSFTLITLFFSNSFSWDIPPCCSNDILVISQVCLHLLYAKIIWICAHISRKLCRYRSIEFLRIVILHLLLNYSFQFCVNLIIFRWELITDTFNS